MSLRGRRVATSANYPVPLKLNKYPNPWEHSSCVTCVHDAECQQSDQFCGSTGCCTSGKCHSDLDCDLQDLRAEYITINNYDSFGYDLNPFQPYDNLEEAEKRCTENTACVAYNSYGFLKYKVEAPVLWETQPPIQRLLPWILYLKKNKLNNNKPSDAIAIPYGIKRFCDLNHAVSDAAVNENVGICRHCLQCKETTDCPSSAHCNSGCCVSNPCYTATPVGGGWDDVGFSRAPQCNCPSNKPYCCRNDTGRNTNAVASGGDGNDTPPSVMCSDVTCERVGKKLACGYLCNARDDKHDSVMCKADETCCNAGTGGPMCCGPLSGCNATSAANACNTPPAKLCESKDAEYYSSMCDPGQTCCNSHLGPATCCNDGYECVPDTRRGMNKCIIKQDKRGWNCFNGECLVASETGAFSNHDDCLKHCSKK